MSAPRPNDSSARNELRAVVVGQSDAFLDDLLADVLRELGVRIDIGLKPDLVLAVVGRLDLREVLRRAVLVADGAPIVAVLPFEDPAMRREALAAGARSCFDLDQPFQTLLALLMPVLQDRAAASARPISPPVRVRLGGAARDVVERACARGLVQFPEVVRRLEQAMQLDAFLAQLRKGPAPDIRGPRLGTHARLEALLLHLDGATVQALEAALDHDERTGEARKAV